MRRNATVYSRSTQASGQPRERRAKHLLATRVGSERRRATLDRRATLAFFEAEFPETGEYLRVPLRRMRAHAATVRRAIGVLESESRRRLPFDDQPALVQRPVMRSAEAHQIVGFVPSPIRARDEMVQIHE